MKNKKTKDRLIGIAVALSIHLIIFLIVYLTNKY